MDHEYSRAHVTDQVLDYLKAKVMEGVWLPGDQIDSEHVLCRELNVSRSTVRSAIQQLIAIGVLESHQGKGTFLKSMVLDDILKNLDDLYVNNDMEQLIEFRRIVEVASSRLAALRIDEGGLEKMKRYLEKMEQDPENREMFIENDMNFHYEILKATGNKVIIRSLEKMGVELRRQHERVNSHENVARAMDYHRRLYEAIAAHDADLAALMMERHLGVIAQAAALPAGQPKHG